MCFFVTYIDGLASINFSVTNCWLQQAFYALLLLFFFFVRRTTRLPLLHLPLYTPLIVPKLYCSVGKIPKLSSGFFAIAENPGADMTLLAELRTSFLAFRSGAPFGICVALLLRRNSRYCFMSRAEAQIPPAGDTVSIGFKKFLASFCQTPLAKAPGNAKFCQLCLEFSWANVAVLIDNG